MWFSINCVFNVSLSQNLDLHILNNQNQFDIKFIEIIYDSTIETDVLMPPLILRKVGIQKRIEMKTTHFIQLILQKLHS